MISVYIASPYTKPDGKQEENAIKSFHAYNELIKHGFTPFAPLTTHYINKHYPQTYDKWMEIDLYWLEKCDCVLRLPGESKGADVEVNYAIKNDIPVFYDLKSLLDYFEGVIR